MLKKLRNTDIDVLMSIWKKAYLKINPKVNNEDLTQAYTSVRATISDKSSDTVLYTEDDVIEGFITVDGNHKIVVIYVDEKIRREGIGSKLIDAYKKEYNDLNVSFKENLAYKKFFEKNGFTYRSTDKNGENTYEWEATDVQSVNVIYFDDDLNEKFFDSTKKILVRKICIKDIIANDKEVKSVKNYMKVRKSIEEAFGKKVVLYLNYGNYHEVLDDIIKEIAKIEKSKFTIVVSEPLIIENPKMEGYLKKIEESYKDYNVYKINTMDDMDKNISVNKILDEKMKVIVKRIEKVAENM